MNCRRARSTCFSWACLASVLLVPAMRGLAAQRREPLLPQVKLPHGYYWREMYVPQPTSGPSSVVVGTVGETSLRDFNSAVADSSSESQKQKGLAAYAAVGSSRK